MYDNYKNTIRDGGSTALYTVYTVDTIDTIDTVDTGNTVYTIQTALHCLNSSMHACIYCKGRLECYCNGLMCITEMSKMLDDRLTGDTH